MFYSFVLLKEKHTQNDTALHLRQLTRTDRRNKQLNRQHNINK